MMTTMMPTIRPVNLGISQAGKDVAIPGELVIAPPPIRFIQPEPIVRKKPRRPKPRPRIIPRAVPLPPAVVPVITPVTSAPKFVPRAPVILPPPPPVIVPKVRSKMPVVLPPPTDERPFIHKKILGGISKLAGILPIPGANIISGIAGGLGGVGRPVISPVTPQTFTPQPQATTIPGRMSVGASGAAPCQFPLILNPQGQCVSHESPLGQGTAVGMPIAGLYGAGFVPGSEIRDIAVCPSGFVLGTDGICYDHLRNRQRMYPRGRRPLLTGGDLNAITKSRSAATKLKNARADLTALGMLKAPTRRRRK